jgi:DEAD/DEAH box helicase domain-containing protein
MSQSLADLFTTGAHGQVVNISHQAARAARLVPLPPELDPALRAALEVAGLRQLYSHQADMFAALGRGANIVVATGTASGKSLGFVLPAADALARDPQSRALFLYPTKALAQDQARKLRNLRLPGVVPAIYDGDTSPAQRGQIRKKATIVLSNPDMVHVGILPGHERWAEFLHHLRYVVLDEAHVYRGVFGSHTAQVVRRLRRLCAAYGATPQFVLASATIANPRDFAERLTGLPFTAISDDGAPHPERTIVFWNPPLLDSELGQRRSALAEAAYVIAEAVLGGARVIGFAPSRKAAELIYTYVYRRLQDRDPAKAERVLPYRAGYTAQQRRAIEGKLFAHELDAVVATQALELGIDVGDLDLALVTGFPGTVTSLWQRWGRAGRAGHGYAVLVAGQDALDQYFMRQPDRLLDRCVEEAIIDLANPHILDAHLQAAAYEAPLTSADERYFGAPGMARAAGLVRAGRLRERGNSLVWTKPHSPAAVISLRSAGSEPFVIVERDSGMVLGTIERERVFRYAHPGAIYLHLGQGFLVEDLDLANHVVLITEFGGNYYTQAKTDKNVLIAGQSHQRELAPGVNLFFGQIEVSEQVIAYQKRSLSDQRTLATIDVDLPEQVFTTEALWLTIAPHVLEAQLTADDLLGSLHAAEHASIAVVPLYAMCDRWDIGGLSTAWHWQTDCATIFIYDGYPGGIGLVKRAFEAFEKLVGDARLLIAECPCESGCPSCVQSPKCGNLNEPLSKAGALALLEALLRSSSDGGAAAAGGGGETAGPVATAGDH